MKKGDPSHFIAANRPGIFDANKSITTGSILLFSSNRYTVNGHFYKR